VGIHFPHTPFSSRPARAEKFSALPRFARQSKFKIWIFVKKGSDFVQKVPPSGKRVFWLARYAGSPAVPPFQEKGGMNFLSLFREAERQKRAFHYFI